MDHASDHASSDISGSPAMLAADRAGIGEAARLLQEGGLVALPTETVYGLAARADRDESVAAIYRAKGRPSFNPLIVHMADTDAARRLDVLDERAERLAAAFWPGALTMVLPLHPDAGIASAVTAGLSTVALRCPAADEWMRCWMAGSARPGWNPPSSRCVKAARGRCCGPGLFRKARSRRCSACPACLSPRQRLRPPASLRAIMPPASRCA